MSDGAISPHIGQECEFQALGQTWRAARWTRKVWKELVAWARPLAPDPLEVALKHVEAASEADERITRRIMAQDHAENLKALAEGRDPVPLMLLPKYRPIANDMVSKAQDEALRYRDNTSPGVQSVINSMEGEERILYELLRPNHPEMTPALAEQIREDLTATEFSRVVLTTSGRTAKPKNPEAPAGDAPSPDRTTGQTTGAKPTAA